MLLALAAGKAASSITSLVFFAQDDVFVYLLNGIVDGSLVFASLLPLLARRPGRARPPPPAEGARRGSGPPSSARCARSPRRSSRADTGCPRLRPRSRSPSRSLGSSRAFPLASVSLVRLGAAIVRVGSVPVALQPPQRSRARSEYLAKAGVLALLALPRPGAAGEAAGDDRLRPRRAGQRRWSARRRAARFARAPPRRGWIPLGDLRPDRRRRAVRRRDRRLGRRRRGRRRRPRRGGARRARARVGALREPRRLPDRHARGAAADVPRRRA